MNLTLNQQQFQGVLVEVIVALIHFTIKNGIKNTRKQQKQTTVHSVSQYFILEYNLNYNNVVQKDIYNNH